MTSRSRLTQTIIPQGAYWIRGESDGNYLGLNSDRSRTTPQSKFSAIKSLSDQSQIWLFELLSGGRGYNIRNAASGHFLDVRASGTADNTDVILWPPNNKDAGTPNQQWRLFWFRDSPGDVNRPTYYIMNNCSLKALDQARNTPGSPTISWTFRDTDNANQLWSLEPVTLPSIYRICSRYTTNYLQYDANSDTATAAKTLVYNDKFLGQCWYLDYQSEQDVYIIRSVMDEQKVLDVSGQNRTEGTPVLTYAEHGGPNQKWKVEALMGTDVRFISTLGGVALTESSSRQTQIMNVDDNSEGQVWRLEQVPVPTPYWHTIQNIESRAFVTDSGSTATPLVPTTPLDRRSWWRFVPKAGQPFLHYNLLNRDSANYLVGGQSSPSVSVASGAVNLPQARWGLDYEADAVGIFNIATQGVLDHYNKSTKLEALKVSDGAENPLRQWSLIPCERRIPSFGIVNARTGRFLKFVPGTSNGSVVTLDYNIHDVNNQWYFYNNAPGTDDSTFAIANSVTGMVLDHFYERALEATTTNADHPHHQWKLIPFGTGSRYFQIKNNASGKLIEEREIGAPNVYPEQSGGDNRGQLWELVSARSQIYDRFNADDHVVPVMSSALKTEKKPSFSLINRKTGRTLNLKSATEANGVITVEGELQDVKNQWYLYASKSDAGAYAIGCKESGMVLDHFYERALEATTTNGDHRHHQWKLIPSGPDQKFFQIQNVASGQAIEERNVGAPNVYPYQAGNTAQQWRLFPSRVQSWDLVTADDDVLSVLGPCLAANSATQLRRHIQKRANHLEKVWPGKPLHFPKESTILRNEAPAIKAVFFHLINQWNDDSVRTSFTADNKVTANRSWVVDKLGAFIPRAVQAGWEKEDWFTIAIQNSYDGGSSGRPLVNIVGKYNKKAALHIVVPVGVTFYRETFRQAMWDSLISGTCVFLDETASLTGPGGPVASALPPPTAGTSRTGNGLVFPTLAMLGSATSFWPLGM